MPDLSSNEPQLSQLQTLTRWSAATSIALIVVTWPLWTPQSVYPQIPAFEALCTAPLWLDWVALTTLLISLLALTLLSKRHGLQRTGVAMFFAVALASLAILFALDQHRFQPWAYELALLCIVALTHSRNLDKRNAVKLMRWLLISIYLYSAIGKLDFEFLHTVGQQMLAVVMKFFNVNAAYFHPQPN